MTARVVDHWSELPRGAREAVKILVLLLVMLLVFAAFFLPLLPNWNGAVGSDYSYYFPSLLAGYYWRLENGVFSIPWFSPSQCGGLPYFADPNTAYFSVPQFLVFLVSPLAAVRLTFLIFAATGFVGMYLLTRVTFRSSVPAAAFASCLFMFNGFYVYRMLIGHLTFHAFMLVPITTAILLPAPNESIPWPGKALRIGGAALCLAYMFHTGIVHASPPALGAIAIIMSLHAYLFGWRRFPVAALTAAGLLALLMSAGKLAASLAFLRYFPRNWYPLPGIPGLWADFAVAFRTVFFGAPENVRQLLTVSPWSFGARAEFEYGVSVAPLLFMVTAATIALLRLLHTRTMPHLSTQRLWALALISLLMLVPIAVNYYQPGWNAFLKRLPFFASNSILLRWFSAYVPVAVLGGALALDRIPPPWILGQYGRLTLAVFGVLVMLGANILTDRSYYGPAHAGRYDVSDIQNGYEVAAAAKAPPEITGISGIMRRDPYRPLQVPLGGNDALTRGMSQLVCYQPIFGYRLEHFPVKRLHAGPALAESQGFLNVKNPACYMFPRENGCEPGDHFRVSEIDAATAFLHYKPFEFRKPLYADLANWISLITLLVVLAGMAGAAILRGTP